MLSTREFALLSGALRTLEPDKTGLGVFGKLDATLDSKELFETDGIPPALEVESGDVDAAITPDELPVENTGGKVCALCEIDNVEVGCKV